MCETNFLKCKCGNFIRIQHECDPEKTCELGKPTKMQEVRKKKELCSRCKKKANERRKKASKPPRQFLNTRSHTSKAQNMSHRANDVRGSHDHDSDEVGVDTEDEQHEEGPEPQTQFDIPNQDNQRNNHSRSDGDRQNQALNMSNSSRRLRNCNPGIPGKDKHDGERLEPLTSRNLHQHQQYIGSLSDRDSQSVASGRPGLAQASNRDDPSRRVQIPNLARLEADEHDEEDQKDSEPQMQSNLPNLHHQHHIRSMSERDTQPIVSERSRVSRTSERCQASQASNRHHPSRVQSLSLAIPETVEHDEELLESQKQSDLLDRHRHPNRCLSNNNAQFIVSGPSRVSCVSRRSHTSQASNKSNPSRRGRSPGPAVPEVGEYDEHNEHNEHDEYDGEPFKHQMQFNPPDLYQHSNRFPSNIDTRSVTPVRSRISRTLERSPRSSHHSGRTYANRDIIYLNDEFPPMPLLDYDGSIIFPKFLVWTGGARY